MILSLQVLVEQRRQRLPSKWSTDAKTVLDAAYGDDCTTRMRDGHIVTFTTLPTKPAMQAAIAKVMCSLLLIVILQPCPIHLHPSLSGHGHR